MSRPTCALLLVLLLVLGGSGRAHPVPDAAPTPTAGATWPLAPRPLVRAPFDPPLSPWGAGHRGVDLAGRVGQPVLAALPGRVTFAARLAGRGVVVVDHGATRTTYEPVVADVAVGARVRAGEHLGRLELVGSHCLPLACLHWGLRRGERYLDPLDLVGAGPVRLFPLQPGPAVPAGPRTGRAPAGPVTPAGAPGGTPPGVGHW